MVIVVTMMMMIIISSSKHVNGRDYLGDLGGGVR
jgi:hypothetical protein